MRTMLVCAVLTLLIVVATPPILMSVGENAVALEVKSACRETWANVHGPDARDGASWNSEWNGDVTEETCGPYFDEFEQEAR